VVFFEVLSTGTFFKIVYDNGFVEWRPAAHLQERLPEENVYILPAEHVQEEGGGVGGGGDSQGLQAAASFDLDGQENTISMHSERIAMVSRLLAWQQHFFDSIYADRA
jgi:hypothetical protein